jgi:ferrous iron transport protein A
MNLTQVEFNKEYTISKITAEEPLKGRLMSFGFAKSNTVTVLGYTLTRQTYEVKIEDSQVALRREEAENIQLESNV